MKASLEFSDSELSIMLDAVTYIYEQAAYSNISSAEKFAPLLTATGLQPPKVTALTTSWVEGRELFLTKLRDQTLGTPLVLDDVQWRLQMTLGSATLSKTKQMNGWYTAPLHHHHHHSPDLI